MSKLKKSFQPQQVLVQHGLHPAGAHHQLICQQVKKLDVNCHASHRPEESDMSKINFQPLQVVGQEGLLPATVVENHFLYCQHARSRF